MPLQEEEETAEPSPHTGTEERSCEGAAERWLSASQEGTLSRTESAGTLILDSQPPLWEINVCCEATQSVGFSYGSPSWLIQRVRDTIRKPTLSPIARQKLFGRISQFPSEELENSVLEFSWRYLVSQTDTQKVYTISLVPMSKCAVKWTDFTYGPEKGGGSLST